jgi:hypothetical protein
LLSWANEFEGILFVALVVVVLLLKHLHAEFSAIGFGNCALLEEALN